MPCEVDSFDKMREANRNSYQFQICGNLYIGPEEDKGLGLVLIGKRCKTKIEHFIFLPIISCAVKKIPQSFTHE